MRDVLLWEECTKLMNELEIAWETNPSGVIILVKGEAKRFLVLLELYGYLRGYKDAR